jgi:hypothetical protein
MQLLAGSGAAAYVCMSGDGSFCCIDGGSESCTCCHHEEGACPDGCEPAHDHESEGHEFASNAPCGCTHVLIAADQASRVTRFSPWDEARRGSQVIPLLPILISCDDQVAAQPQLRWHGPPPLPDRRLVLMASVVIRC